VRACALFRCVHARFLEFPSHRKTENGVRASGHNNCVANSENVRQGGSEHAAYGHFSDLPRDGPAEKMFLRREKWG
jgi:hypothetical protein